MQNNALYLSLQLVVMALADTDVEEEKKKMLQKLFEFPIPKEFMKEKPKMPVITPLIALSDLVGNQSWILFHLAQVTHDQVKAAAEGDFSLLENFQLFVKVIEVPNNCAERNIKLIQDFLISYRNEEHKQNVLLVARNHRKKLNKNLTKSQLNKIQGACYFISTFLSTILQHMQYVFLYNFIFYSI